MFREFRSIPLPRLIREVEDTTGLKLCLKAFDRDVGSNTLMGDIPYRNSQHFTPFCQRVKVTANARCVQCDLGEVTQKALEHPEPFVHVCHANALEFIIPLVLENRLAGIAYLGQFRVSETGARELPELSEQQLDAYGVLALCLQRYLLYEIEHATKVKRGLESRREQIIRIVKTRCHHSFPLEALARELRISVSRTGHLVKELTGMSFVELKQQLRLEAAKQMLVETLLSVESIAVSVGYNDVRYFYRVFTEATGLPPGQWRTTHLPRERVDA